MDTTFILGAASVLALLIAVVLFASVVRGAGYLPTREAAVRRMLELAEGLPGERMADLGSGDGRLVIAFARAGLDAHGYEINPFLVVWSRWRIRRAGLSARGHIHWGSFWAVDCAPFQVVTVFGSERVMRELERKLQRELQPGARVISYAFRFPEWASSRRDRHLYRYDA